MQMRELTLKTVDETKRSVDVIASTETIDSYGEIVEQVWQLDRFKKNPVVLFAHNSRELSIGRAENVRVENGELRMRICFSTAAANPKAEQVWQGVREGSIRGVSVGFVPNSERYEKRNGVEVRVLSNNELHEVSVVPVPANPDALMRMKAAGSPAVDFPPELGEGESRDLYAALLEPSRTLPRNHVELAHEAASRTHVSASPRRRIDVEKAVAQQTLLQERGEHLGNLLDQMIGGGE